MEMSNLKGWIDFLINHNNNYKYLNLFKKIASLLYRLYKVIST